VFIINRNGAIGPTPKDGINQNKLHTFQRNNVSLDARSARAALEVYNSILANLSCFTHNPRLLIAQNVSFVVFKAITAQKKKNTSHYFLADLFKIQRNSFTQHHRQNY